ncbi:MAG TPA: D-glycero-beta-D-manno-heptose-7-phosphate kinase [Burkholderiaceae bacterium]|jgi:rfaE bifunctional protein kinase chain/domain|nr:D-glycero-beta-D-manno-heptose-7-phosphate kinase [Burkholderiaceae bacterium]
MSEIDAPRLRRVRLLIVGDVMLDRYWFGDVERISPEAPVPVVRISSTEERLGGAANVARNVTALGASAGLLSVVGNDESGRAVATLLRDARVADHLHVDANLATTVKLRVIGRRQQIARLDFESAPEAEVLAAHFQQFQSLLDLHDLVVLSDYGKGGLTHIVRMIEAARVAGRAVIVDPKGDDYTRYAGATLITPNRAELREVVGRWRDESDLERRAQKLRVELGLQAVLLTRSEEGISVFTGEGSWTVPAQAREVFDVSGAGDTVIAVLGTMLAAGLPLREAVSVANRAGGIVVGKLGTATVTYDELFGAD